MTKSHQKKNFKELDEIGATPNSHDNFQKIQDDNKENFSVNSNINNLDTKMKTNDEILSSEKNETDNDKNNNMNIINFVRNDSEELLLEEKEEKEDKNRDNIKDEILNEIQNLTNLNNINFNNNENININNFNFNIENAINNLLNKNNDHIFASNEKENIRIDYKKNIYKTPQPFKANSASSINLSSNDLKEAFYIPRKLSNIYDMYNTQQQPNFFERKSSMNNFNFLTTIKKPQISMSNKQKIIFCLLVFKVVITSLILIYHLHLIFQ